MKKRKKSGSTGRGKKRFTEKDFVRSVWKTMEKQAKSNPAIGLLHRRLVGGAGSPGGAGKTLLIGLTGGIATGKSLVASFLLKRRVPVIDADKIARDVVKPKKEGFLKVVASFGQGIVGPEGTIERELLGEIVFSHPEKRKLLEEITHPLIFAEIQKEVKKEEKKKRPLVVIDAPLLFETDLDRLMDKTILVTAHPTVQMKRLMARDHLTEAEAWKRILSQMPTAQKGPRADFVIDNSETPSKTEKQLEAILEKILRLRSHF